MNTQICTKCGIEYPLSEEFFYKGNTKSGFRSICKSCFSEQGKRYRSGYGDAQRKLDNPETDKTCSVCGKTYPATLEYFPQRWKRNNETDLHTHCLECHTEVRQKHRKGRDPEKVKAEKRRHYQKHKETNNKRSRRWYKKNNVRIRREFKERYDNDPEFRRYYIDNMVQYQKDNPLWVRARGHKRRIRIMKNGGNHTADDIKRIYSEQDGRCFYCAIPLFNDFHVDHMLPLSRGGSNAPDNLCCACADCNLSKSDKTIQEWQLIRGW